MTTSSADMTLRINEIFYSLQGETSRTGLPTTFVRLTGCPLRCNYCDTTYAFSGGTSMSLDAIMQAVQANPTRYVCVTGGEPLAQKNCLVLLTRLCDQGFQVSLETSGALDTAPVDPRVAVVLDVKTPASGESSRNLTGNLDHLRPQDEIKFVLCDEADYRWAREFCEAHQLERRNVLFSAAQGQLEARDLADWILRDKLQVRLQIQLHKLLWGNQQGK